MPVAHALAFEADADAPALDGLRRLDDHAARHRVAGPEAARLAVEGDLVVRDGANPWGCHVFSQSCVYVVGALR